MKVLFLCLLLRTSGINRKANSTVWDQIVETMGCPAAATKLLTEPARVPGLFPTREQLLVPCASQSGIRGRSWMICHSPVLWGAHTQGRQRNKSSLCLCRRGPCLRAGCVHVGVRECVHSCVRTPRQQRPISAQWFRSMRGRSGQIPKPNIASHLAVYRDWQISFII